MWKRALGHAADWSIVALVVLANCSSGTRVPPTAPPFGGFATQAAREAACLDLRDHVVDLYVQQNVREHPEQYMTDPNDLARFRDAWAGELAKAGAFARFEASCFTTMTEPGWRCAMGTVDAAAVTPCLRFAR